MTLEKISYWEYGFLKWIMPLVFGGMIAVISIWSMGNVIKYYPNDYTFFGVLLASAIIWYISTTLSMRKILKFIPRPIESTKEQSK